MPLRHPRPASDHEPARALLLDRGFPFVFVHRATARARASLQLSLRLTTADLRQAPNCPPPRSTFPHCYRRWAVHSPLSVLRTSANLASATRHGYETSGCAPSCTLGACCLPGQTPGQSFPRSATQCPTLHRRSVSCAVAFDDHNIKTAPIIRMIFTTEGPHTRYSPRALGHSAADQNARRISNRHAGGAARPASGFGS